MLKLGLVLFGLAVASAAPAATLKVDPNHVAYIHGVVNGGAVYAAMDEITKAEARSQRLFTLIIDSPGGYVDAGLKLINLMQAARARGMRFQCMVTGQAMSMAYYILAECDHRFALPQAQLLWHPIRISFRGALTGIEAANIGRTLIAYENSMKARMIGRMRCGEDWFNAHWLAETQWHAEDLRVEVPGFLRVVDGVTGLKTSQLFYVPQAGFGFQDAVTDIADKPKLIW